MSSGFQASIKKKYESLGYKVVKVMKLSENGYPDLLCMKNGESVWIESKEANDTLKPLQMFRIDELNANGFKAFCLQKGKGVIYPKGE
jgi:Holliday junction resolvase